METIPSGKDRSMFACTKYQFMLDADFEICNKCCNVMKKSPFSKYTKETGRHPITGQLASESRLRTQVWLKQGCNAYDSKKPVSSPMAFWTDSDVLEYIYRYGDEMIANKKNTYLEEHPEAKPEDLTGGEWDRAICSVYGEIVPDVETEIEGQMTFGDYGIFDGERPLLKTTGERQTGCVLCGFGAHLDKPNEQRFVRLKKTHPQYAKALHGIKNNGVSYAEAIDWINEHGGFNIQY